MTEHRRVLVADRPRDLGDGVATAAKSNERLVEAARAPQARGRATELALERAQKRALTRTGAPRELGEAARVEEVRLDVSEGTLDAAAVSLHEGRAIRSFVAVAEEEVQLLQDLRLEETRGDVVVLPERVALEDVAMDDLVNPDGAREQLAVREPALPSIAIEAELRVRAVDGVDDGLTESHNRHAPCRRSGAKRRA